MRPKTLLSIKVLSTNASIITKIDFFKKLNFIRLVSTCTKKNSTASLCCETIIIPIVIG